MPATFLRHSAAIIIYNFSNNLNNYILHYYNVTLINNNLINVNATKMPPNAELALDLALRGVVVAAADVVDLGSET